ncbi:DNA invertase Pin-like site-specific DNA recombinase [Hymenobacter luteus]|uniref:DNA invertase Pin-like site-specific DNA recombinase n=2 Tax=Hymenobacter TaxID=89966 RepID=A0A7W9WAX6_9BACT|nr:MULTISPECIES: recombinase family protein [Hymenobacter]MBB4601375.1 DNA invertase Pin-like site-specific DNA recombinase [Hymenobacter latericoloratus]MBB6058418.1 DNA invertase Pin-like site-specific DNA recombinase [Hymenobacter luteus]
MKTYVTYLRVSTKVQGGDGLGIGAQRSTVNQFVGNSGTILKEFVEVESGSKNDRPQLHAAIAEAKSTRSRLVIAKLDRLSRNAAFIFTLRDTGVDFVACDMPDANTLTVGIFAVIAQHERETISLRTKAALGAKRAKGETLGKPENFTQVGRDKGRETQQQQAKEALSNVQAAHLIPLLLQQNKTLREVASILNQNGYRTRRGKEFTATQVMRLAAAV